MLITNHYMFDFVRDSDHMFNCVACVDSIRVSLINSGPGGYNVVTVSCRHMRSQSTDLKRSVETVDATEDCGSMCACAEEFDGIVAESECVSVV